MTLASRGMSARRGADARPWPIRAAQLTLAVHALVHLGVPLLMELQRASFAAVFARLHPELGPVEVAAAVAVVLRAGLVYHLVFAALFGGWARGLSSGRRWMRVALTLVCVLGMLGTSFSFMSPTPTPRLYKSLNGLSWLLALSTLGLIWIGGPARRFWQRRGVGLAASDNGKR